jgi:hypothetical protein
MDHFAGRGYKDVEPLAAGMREGVYRLGGGLVAKVWATRSMAELLCLKDFYADVARANLPFATPEFLGVEDIDGMAVTLERELQGRHFKPFVRLPGRGVRILGRRVAALPRHLRLGHEQRLHSRRERWPLRMVRHGAQQHQRSRRSRSLEKPSTRRLLTGIDRANAQKVSYTCLPPNRNGRFRPCVII